MIIPHDAWGNPLPRPEDRIRKLSRMVTPGPDARDAQIAALEAENAGLKAHIEELRLQVVALSASATVPSSASVSATPAAEKIKTAPNNISAKLKDEPWVEMGLSRRTYYRRKAAGSL